MEQRSCKQDDEKEATKEGKRRIDRGWLKKDVVGKMRRGRVQLSKAEANSSASDDKVSTFKSRIETDSLSRSQRLSSFQQLTENFLVEGDDSLQQISADFWQTKLLLC